MPESDYKDSLATSFGLVIAYILPGMAGLFGLTFWFPGLRHSFVAFEKSASNVGIFLLVLMLALMVGLILNSVRWAIFEAWHHDRLKTEELANLMLDRQKVAAYRARLEEDFRYHQFNGNTALALLILIVGSLKTDWAHMRSPQIAEECVTAFIIGAVFVAAAIDRYRRFVDGTRHALHK